MSVPTFIKMKHFNSDVPQNCNVYIADIKSKYALIYDGNKWNVTNKNKLLDEMYSENCDYLLDEYEEKQEELDELTLSKFKKFLDNKDTDETSNVVKENIKQMLYNEKDMIIEIRKHHNLN